MSPYDWEWVARDFLLAVAGSVAALPRPNRCVEVGRCVLDERCPLVADCELSDYVE